MTRFAHRIAVTVFAGCLAAASSAQPPDWTEGLARKPILAPPPHGLAFLLPVDGAKVSTDRAQPFAVELPGANFAQGDPIHARVVARGPAGETVLAEGDARFRLDTDRIGGDWRTRGLPSGTYTLTAELTVKGRTETASVTVQVRQPPVVDVRLVDLAIHGSQVVARFAAHAASGDGAPVRRYSWIGDRNLPAEVTHVSHWETRYLGFGGRHEVSVQAFDDHGGVGERICRLEIPPRSAFDEAALAEIGKRASFLERFFSCGRRATCGCESMTIFHRSGETEIYCQETLVRDPTNPGVLVFVPPFPDDSCRVLAPVPADNGGCPEGESPFRCQTGRLAPDQPGRQRLAFGFEVISFLTDGSDADACEEGQYARVTRGFGGQVVANPASRDAPEDGSIDLPNGDRTFTFSVVDNGDPVPSFFSSNFGADNYAAANGISKRHNPPGRVVWRDTPSPGFTIPRNAAAAFPAVAIDEYIAFIRGSDDDQPTCWCHFQIDYRYDPANPNTKGTGLGARQKGMRCGYSGS